MRISIVFVSNLFLLSAAPAVVPLKRLSAVIAATVGQCEPTWSRWVGSVALAGHFEAQVIVK